MTEPSGLERVAALFKERVGSASRATALLLLLVVVAGAAHLARRGTLPTRAGAVVLMFGALLGVLVGFYRRRRDLVHPRGVLKRVVAPGNPKLGERALRALGLFERADRTGFVESRDLLDLHWQRILASAESDAVREHIDRRALRFRAVSFGLILLFGATLALGPLKLVEGLDVLLAVEGRAPLPLPLLELRRVRIRPPAYLHESDRFVFLGARTAAPLGSVVSVRGVPAEAGRTLVLTDGTREVAFLDDGNGGQLAEWPLTDDTELSVAARFGEVLITDEVPITLEAVFDRAPEVVVEDTPRAVALAEVERIELEYRVEDDHGLRQIDLVLRTGRLVERRTLARLNGETQYEVGGHALLRNDPVFRSFLPVVITVEARDDNPEAQTWGTSSPIIVLPTEVGAGQAARFRALSRALQSVVAWLAKRQSERGAVDSNEALQALGEAVGGNFLGLAVPRGVRSFLLAQSSALKRHSGAGAGLRGAEDIALAVDSAVRAVGRHGAEKVAPELGDVAEELAVAADELASAEDAADARARLDALSAALSLGLGHLSVLGVLGKDLGSVGRADLGRIERLRDSKSWRDVERAARHLAARLRRPRPSFGANTPGGVESGGGAPAPSDEGQESNKEPGELGEEELGEESEGPSEVTEDPTATPSPTQPLDGSVPEPNNEDTAQGFRDRVLRGLENSSGRLAPAVRRYAERLLE